jgi:UDP-GlcNAc:undecaprenyl-phosphate/decaprenyl-phosphate GlcNAc-1-phosphate transferase
VSVDRLVGPIVAFVVSFIAVTILTPLAGRVGQKIGLVDRPRAGELQKEPLARSGGYAMVASFILAVAVSLMLFPRNSEETTRIVGLVVGVLFVLPIAFVDDFKRLGPLPQLLGQIGLAAIAMVFGVVITSIANPFGGLISLPVFLAIPFTLVWIVGMVNTINVIDTMDGLAAGGAAIAACVLFARSLSQGQDTISLLPVALAGVCVGFLRFNFNPARIIMGTSGSMFLGFALATFSLIGGAKIATAAFVLGLPIIDFAMVIVQRAARRRSPMDGGDDAHLTHRLVRRGLSTRRIALSIYAVCATGGAMAMTLNGLQKLLIITIVGVIAIVMALRLASDRSKVVPQATAHDIN